MRVEHLTHEEYFRSRQPSAPLGHEGLDSLTASQFDWLSVGDTPDTDVPATRRPGRVRCGLQREGVDDVT